MRYTYSNHTPAASGAASTGCLIVTAILVDLVRVYPAMPETPTFGTPAVSPDAPKLASYAERAR